ncbi:ATP-dependent helicase [Flavobacteriales bacterium]|nr:ATP-dependent helicase [Flavobacteriales bacterium]
MDYLDELNKAQRDAVENIKGPSMVIAGAGSGKTRVLTYRIAHMIHNNIDAFNILALTFTNKAAKEMKERIAAQVSESEARNIWMGTFHSIFARILRTESEKLGYPSNFTIYDAQDSKNLIKAIVKEMGLDDKIYKPNIIANRISNAKNNLVSARSYLNNTTIQSDDRQSAKPKLGEIYETYERRCFKAGAMDFDDLLFKTNVLLRDFPDTLFKYQDKFRYIMVDEFQDTNFSQYLIVKTLAARFENICVVGDDAQSIYAFRGASIQNILNFKRDYPDAKTFKLEQNYRSTETIVKAANSIIKKNKDQIEKDVWTSNETGKPIKVLRSLTDNEEGLSIASEIFTEKVNGQRKNLDFAILYRTNAQSRAMEEALRKKDIPYRIYGGLSFYQRKEIKDLLGYYRLILNPKDEEALKRVINYPARGIGKTSMDKIIVAANANDVSLWDVLTKPQEYNAGIGSAVVTKIQQFTNMISGFRAQEQSKNAFDLGQEIASLSGILTELYNDKTPEGVSRYENIQELLNGLKEFIGDSDSEESQQKTLSEFMQDIALLTDADKQDDNDNDKVTLMTIHASKGLEFPFVYIVGLEENLFPSQLSLNSRADLEEERRLFYVAVTRGETKVTLSYATSRYKWGNLVFCEPSRFIEEIDPQFVDLPDESIARSSMPSSRTKTYKNETNNKNFKSTTAVKKTTYTPPNPRQKLVKVQTSSQKASANYVAPQLTEGMQVEHERFGSGTVTNIEGQSPNQKATVSFEGHGEKKLLLKFARLKVLN